MKFIYPSINLFILSLGTLVAVGCTSTNKRTVSVIQIRAADAGQALASAGKQSEVTINHGGDASLKPGAALAIYNAADTAGAERKAVVTATRVDKETAVCRVDIQYESIKPGDWGYRLQPSIDGHQRGPHTVGPELHPPIHHGHDPTD